MNGGISHGRCGIIDQLFRLIRRYRADWHRRGVEVHDAVGPEPDGGAKLLQLISRGAGDGRIADVGVDLALRPRATSLRMSSGARCSRRATNAISSVTMPLRAASSCVM
jgi:hypothetical protein